MVNALLDIEIQEEIFIASLYTDQTQIRRYGGMLNTQKVFQTPLGASLWEKSWEYYTKYGALPLDEDTQSKIFNDKEMESLNTALDIAKNTKDRAQFLRDKFMHTLDLTYLKSVYEDIGRLLNNPRLGTEDGDVILDGAFDRLLGKIARARVSADQAGIEVHSGFEIKRAWEYNEYPSQGGMFPVALPGIIDSKGESKISVPIGTVNVIVGSYGSGKSTILACMATEYLRFGHVLYVTLEISENAIYFKMLAHVSDGLTKPGWAFVKQETLTDAEYKIFDQSAKDLARHGPASDDPKDEYKYKHNIHILDAPADGLRPSEVANHITRMMAEHQIAPVAIMVDYAALMRTNDNGNRSDLGWQYVGTIITELSAIAKKHNVVVWTAAQVGGEQGHTDSIAVSEANKVKPEFRTLGGKDLYGSKEALHNASLVFGVSVLRSADCPWIASGVLSTWKNRYSESFNDWMVRLDYSKSRITVMEPLLSHDKADVVQMVINDLKQFKVSAEKDAKHLGLEIITSKGGKGISMPPAKSRQNSDVRVVETQGHDVKEYGE